MIRSRFQSKPRFGRESSHQSSVMSVIQSASFFLLFALNQYQSQPCFFGQLLSRLGGKSASEFKSLYENFAPAVTDPKN